MGQYGNQPDFATKAALVIPTGQPGNANGVNLNSAALYIGTGGTLCVNIVGGNNGFPTEATILKNIPDGTFMPIIVTNVWTGNDDGETTTCSNIVALY